MINILMPMAGKSIFFDSAEYRYPKPLLEINGRMMVEWAIDTYNMIKEEKRFIFVVSSSDCSKYHIDNVLKLLTDGNCEIIRLGKETSGAACSALLAIEYINNQDKLIIANNDQVIKRDMNIVLNTFEKNNVDAGVICFQTVHPRWSYVMTDKAGKIIEAAEKRPISKNAIAGFYYFKEGKSFVMAAMKSIEKDASVNDLYYVAPVFNELILENKNLEIYKIKNEEYHTFYSPQMIKEYEQQVKK